MIKQIKSSEIKKYIKENSNIVLLDVRTENEWLSLGKPNAEELNSKTYFVTVSHDLTNWQVPDPNFKLNCYVQNCQCKLKCQRARLKFQNSSFKFEFQK